MPLSWSEIRDRSVAFSREYRDAASEKSKSQQFWRDFFHVFGVDSKKVAAYEQQVKLTRAGLQAGDANVISNGWIDVFWRGKLLIEMKSAGQNLDRAFAQALQYFDNLPSGGLKDRDLPRYILVCDFQNFRLFDLQTNEEKRFKLADLSKNIKAFGFIPGYEVQAITPQDPVNVKAAERMGRLHDGLKASGYTGHDLEVLLVRLLFCLFADDTGIFQPAGSFKDLLDDLKDPATVGRNINELFEILNTPEAKRQKAHQDNYQAFRYINGKLFEERISTAAFDGPMREALLDAAALDWSSISPAIFGALFQSIMDTTARRNLGAHYTSEENILKLIKPLFLDELWAEFARVKNNRNRLFEFHKRLRMLTFFDPACGCGNFLVITYRELRKLEVDILRTSYGDGQQMLDVHQFTTVDVDQFYGIEIEEFPAQIAQVAMWLTDHQMNRALSDEFGKYFDRLPLKSTPHIRHGNALQIDWQDVLPSVRCSYVLGNPPFVGYSYQSAAQKADMAVVMQGVEGSGVLDFVTAWYVKAARYIKAENWGTGKWGQIPIQDDTLTSAQAEKWGQIPIQDNALPGARAASTKLGSDPTFPLLPETTTRIAFVSTNSITQGEQVGVLWSWLLAQGMHIHFAHRTFRWSNEASGKAAVHCVIIGFGTEDINGKTIYEYENINGEPVALPAKNINPYLVDAPNVFLQKRSIPISAVPALQRGSDATDDGNLLLSDEDRNALIQVQPEAAQWIKRFVMGNEFINNIPRWCLWLEGISPAALRAMPAVNKRIAAVKTFRQSSKRAKTQQMADYPSSFSEPRQPTTRYLAIPKVSSERRDFIPIAFLDADVVAGDKIFTMPGATLLHFGILTSTMHMAWVRKTCGRLKSDYSYSNTIVYNNYPWPTFKEKPAKVQTSTAQAAIESAAQAVLDARAQFAGSSLADLYDPLTMPPALVKAHQKLDAAVDAAYAQDAVHPGKKAYATDAERVAYLFELYQRLTSLLPSEKAKKKR
jgi:N-6 DNA Methylase